MTQIETFDRISIIPGNPLRGSISLKSDWKIPGDKSISHRAALFASLADGESHIHNFQVSGVTLPMLRNLKLLGVHWELFDDHLFIIGKGCHGFDPRVEVLDCGNSATTLRLLAGALAMQGVNGILDGSESLRRRPMLRIIEPLQKMGVRILSDHGHAPLYIDKFEYPLKGMYHDIQVASAQVKTCILLAGLTADSETSIEEPGPSRDHTERMLIEMGVNISSECIERGENKFFITRLNPLTDLNLKPIDMIIPCDFSAAAFLIIGGCITPGSEIQLKGVGINPTRTGLLDALKMMDASIEITNISWQNGEPIGDIKVTYRKLHGINLSGEIIVRMIDEFPAFAIVAACASGKTIVQDARELRYKESDRIHDLCTELHKLGVDVTELADGFEINGGEIHGADVNHHGDHRLAMAMVIAGLASNGKVGIHSPDIIKESFPDFLEVLQTLGGKLQFHNQS